jgi:hypothetical protein
VLGLQPLQPRYLTISLQLRLGLFRHGQVVACVLLADPVALARLLEPLPPVLADRLQQAVAHRPVWLLRRHQRLVDQLGEQLQHIVPL